MTVVALIDYSFLMKFPWIYYSAMMVLLVMVELWGKNVNGAQRWLAIGGDDSGITIQPSEFAKLAIVAFFAYYFTKYLENLNTPRILFSSFAYASNRIPLYSGL